MNKIFYYAETPDGEIMARDTSNNGPVVLYRPKKNKDFCKVNRDIAGKLSCHYKLNDAVIKLINHAFKIVGTILCKRWLKNGEEVSTE
jgi:hypothetical protein